MIRVSRGSVDAIVLGPCPTADCRLPTAALEPQPRQRGEHVGQPVVLGPVEEHVRRLVELKGLGVDQFAVYLQHDAKESTLAAYAEHVIPAVADVTLSKT